MSFRLLPLAVLVAATGASAQLSNADAASSAPGDTPTRVSDFLASLPVHPGVDAEIARFEDGRLDPDYRAAFVRAARVRLGSEVETLTEEMLRSGCEAAVSVEFPGEDFSGLPDPSSVQEDFEDSIVLTRATACYQTDLTPDELLRLYASREVRMAAQSRMEDVYEEDGLFCYDVGGVPILLSPTRSCNDVTRMADATAAAEHSQSVRSEAEDHQPIYFKESLKTALLLPDGTTGLVHVTVTRSTGLGGLEKRLGRGKIEDSIRRQTEVLGERLSSGGDDTPGPDAGDADRR